MTAWVEWIATGLRRPRGGRVLAIDGEDAGKPEPGESDGDSAGKSGEKAEPARGGPRNPWQGPGARPRRPASLDDLFRNRPGGGAPPGGRPGGGPGGAPSPLRLPPAPGGRGWTPLVLGGVAVLWLVMGTAHQLSSNEEGIVTTFGKYTSTIGPGMNLTAPWPIQRVRVEDVTSIRRDSLPDGEAENLMLTSDQSLVDLSYMVRWNIRNLKQYAYQLKDPQATVREVAEAAMRSSVAEVPLNGVMGGSGRAEIEANVRSRMQAVLDAYHAGILIQGVDIKKADPPAKVNAAFQKVQAAQQNYNTELSNAQAYAQQVKALAEGSATQFNKVYEQYRLAPEVTRRRLYYETMEQVLRNNDKVIAPAGGVTSYLPLPAIQKKAIVPDAPQQPGNGQ